MIYNGFLFLVLLFQFLKTPFSKKKPPVIQQRWNFPKNLQKGEKPLYWFHAVSYGEMKALFPFIQRMQKEFPWGEIWVSTITRTGFALAKQLKGITSFYLPFDFSFIMEKVQKFAPERVFLSEGDFWPNFLQNAKKAGAKITVLSAKLSERSFKRYKKVPFLTKKLFSLIDLFCVQNQSYFHRFKELGVSSSKLRLSGNLKLQPNLAVVEDLKEKLSIVDKDFVITIGSSHKPEEKLLLRELKPLLEQKALKIFLAPRHIERVSSLKKHIANEGIPFTLFSDKKASFSTVSVILVDQMGVLPSCYKASNLAIVAGSFLPSLEGHNLLEPALLQVPVLFGPYTSSQKELKNWVIDYRVGKEVLLSEVSSFLLAWMENPTKLKAMQKSCSNLSHFLSKSLDKTWDLVFSKN